MKELWTEVYRPTTIRDYVFKDKRQQSQIETWVNDKSIPHLLFSGVQGTGKTTLAKVLVNELGIGHGDYKYINASRDNGVDYIRDTITNFATTMSFGDFKVILLDEADYLSPNAQAALRGVMEQFSSVVRFILTCNYPDRVIPAIHSRCQGFHIDALDKTEFTARVATILIEEKVEFDLETLDNYVSATYPDLRKCINLVDMNSTTEKLSAVDNSEVGTSDFKLEVVALFKSKKYVDARKLICSQIKIEEYNDFYRFMYDNLDFWANDALSEMEAIMIIRNGLVKHPLAGDPEINLSACLCELEMLTMK